MEESPSGWVDVWKTQMWRGQLLRYSESHAPIMRGTRQVLKLEEISVVGMPRVLASVVSMPGYGAPLYTEMTFWLGDQPQVSVSVQATTIHLPPIEALEEALTRLKVFVHSCFLPEWAKGSAAEAEELDKLWGDILCHAHRAARETSPEAQSEARMALVDRAIGAMTGAPADAVEDCQALYDSSGADDESGDGIDAK